MAIQKKQKIYKIISLALLLGVLILIFLLSAQKANDSSQTSGFLTHLLGLIFPFPVTDDSVRILAHFAEYFVLSTLMSNAFVAFKKTPYTILSTILSSIYALSDEIHQYFVPGRAFQVSDIILDIVGVIVGTLVFRMIFEIIKKMREKQLKLS